ncbi:MAG: HU family DNA-binding protein [Phascolarctobacterium sp.]|nr:HU family DNA-binding protein [Phascolarctobacterium sp.]
MNKVELVAAVAAKAGVSKKVAEKVVVAFVASVKETVAKRNKVQLIGFGTFEARARKARTGKNPRTGKPLKIAAATVPAFKAGKAFKEVVNHKGRK